MTQFETEIDRCDCNSIHEDVIDHVRRHLPAEEHLIALADLFKVFSDSTRVKIVSALFQAEMCVCDIAVLLGMTKSAISHQLRVLKQAKLVKNRREGKIVFYSLADSHVQMILDQGMLHIME